MNLATKDCGTYTLDVSAMLGEIFAACASIQEKTNRYACAIDLHPDDADRISVYTFGRDSEGHIQQMTGFVGIPVIIDRSAGRRRGVALIRQCEPPHPTPADCPHASKTRFVSRGEKLDVETPRLDQL